MLFNKPTAQLAFETVTSRMKGGRPRQEDTVNGITLEHELWGEVNVQMIADGHGSHSVSNYLKKNFIPTFVTEFNRAVEDYALQNKETLELIMIPVLKRMNISLQNQIEASMEEQCKTRKLNQVAIEFKNPIVDYGFQCAVSTCGKFLEVSTAQADGEAERLGIKAGWKVLSIDSEYVNERNVYQLASRIHKQAFSSIRFEVPRVGSTCVAAFTFKRFNKLFTFCLGDSRFMLFETKYGKLVHGLTRLVDLADGSSTVFTSPQPCKNFLHQCLGPIAKIQNYESDSSDGISSYGRYSKYSYYEPKQRLKDQYYMVNDPTGRGFREYELWSNNKETNPEGKFIIPNDNYGKWTFDASGLQPSRALGDKGSALHMGEIYICDLPTDQETWLVLISDGIEEAINISEIPYYVLEPKTQLKDILDDHRAVNDFVNYRNWFATQLDIHELPLTKDIEKQLAWLETVYEFYERIEHFPSKRHAKTHKNAIHWLKKSHSRMSKPNFVPNMQYRVKFLMHSAYARLCFDNVSVVVQRNTPIVDEFEPT